jgi:hypothetical protein
VAPVREFFEICFGATDGLFDLSDNVEPDLVESWPPPSGFISI